VKTSPTPAPRTFRTLRRLILVRGENHLALLPIEEDEREHFLSQSSDMFSCPCGAEFKPTFELSSWTTEYVPRCLTFPKAFGGVS
jgi:hypothetical protein